MYTREGEEHWVLFDWGFLSVLEFIFFPQDVKSIV